MIFSRLWKPSFVSANVRRLDMQYGSAQHPTRSIACPDLLRGAYSDLPHILEPVQAGASARTLSISHHRHLGRDVGAGAVLGDNRDLGQISATGEFRR